MDHYLVDTCKITNNVIKTTTQVHLKLKTKRFVTPLFYRELYMYLSTMIAEYFVLITSIVEHYLLLCISAYEAPGT